MIADIGDCVQYNGKLEYAQNDYTKFLMQKFLTTNEIYKISKIMKSCGKFYYRFENGGAGYWYPAKSFNYYSRSLIKMKYNLR